MDTESEITLGVLSAVVSHRSPTQRAIAREVGIALGLANSYLRRCVTKGYIKISQAPANRYVYYLTPTGFAEKSRLTAEYLRQSFSLYRQARTQYFELFALCEARGWNRVGLYGLGDLCEIALLCAHESKVAVVGVVQPGTQDRETVGIRVHEQVADLGPLDAMILTDMRESQQAYDALVGALSRERVLAPRLLEVALAADAGNPE